MEDAVTVSLKEDTPFYRDVWFTSLVTIFFYFFIGTCYYHYELGWEVDEAIYFAVVVATTVGYGDNQSLETRGAMLFTTFYVLGGERTRTCARAHLRVLSRACR